MFHNLAVPVLHLFILTVKFLSLYVDELNDDDDSSWTQQVELVELVLTITLDSLGLTEARLSVSPSSSSPTNSSSFDRRIALSSSSSPNAIRDFLGASSGRPCACSRHILTTTAYTRTGVAGPSAAQGGGSNLPPFRLRFLKQSWRNTNTNKVEVRTGRSQGPNVIADDRYTLAVTLCFSCTQTHETYNLNFHVNFVFNFRRFSPLCRP